ncbi:MAG TPA: methyltransferase domain-containing protein [Blastocatellia bacterium]|nr:methyltransferase domain-containing protein [Blastocatellia bacterium]HMV86983.1 methyltransferase domain-containing protein [Blastocatellia bacterium]HMY75325.1 methyltransferase domain-containing protein [Blastocatellia bacterium]HMZ17015.1 methyltransferase domain-containing protein [Blastocatellia bacterium]HNG33017.1 methyltransferase domain-containing protein [Blastocatellia bacterium]
MLADERLIVDRFPRASAYHPEWVISGASGGANPLWLTEWLCESLDLQPGMRVLDLGCGRALSSIFLHREFGVQVWATDLWFSAAENLQRVQDAGVHEGVFPISADARSLPFSEGFFDAVVSIDSFMFYGTDDLYLNYLARFVKPGGPIGIALAGYTNEVSEPIPAHLSEWWADELAHCMHSADWWSKHWERGGALDVAVADSLPDGWQYWRDWLKLIAPENEKEIGVLEADAGRTFGYVRAIGHRRQESKLFDPRLTVPAAYASKPLLRTP